MATTKWIIPFQSLDGTDYRVEIAVEVGTEDAVTLIGGESPIVTEEDDNEDLFVPVRTQSGYVRFVDVNNIWEQVIPASSTARPVFLYKVISNIKTLMWKGYLQPQTFTGDYIRTPQVRELPICCPLSILETWDVEAGLSAGFINFAAILHYIFSKLGTANPSQSDDGYWFAFQGGSQVEDWLQKRVLWESLIEEDEEGYYSPKYNCLELLEHVCTFFGWVCRIYGKTIYFACPDYATGDFRRMTLGGIEQIANGQTAITTTISWAEGVLSDGMFASTRNRETIVRGIRKATVEADTGEYDTLLDVPFDKIAKAIRNNSVYSSQYRAAQPASGDDPAVPEGVFFWRHVPYYADQRFGGVLISTRICNSAGLTGPYYQGRIDDYEFYDGGIKDKHNYALTTDLYIVGMAPKGSPDTSNVDVTDTDTTDNTSEGWIISDNDQPAAIGKTVISVSALAVIQTVRSVMLCHGVLVLQGSLQTDYIHSGHDTVSPTGTLSLRISVGDYYFVYFGSGAGYWAYQPDSTLKEGDCWLDVPVERGRIATTRNLMSPYPAYEGFGMVVQDGYGTSLAGVEGRIKIEVRGWEPTGESNVYGTIYHRDDEGASVIPPNSSIHFDGYGTSNVHISSLALKFYRHNDYDVHSELSANKYIVAGSEIFRDTKGASTKWYTDNANNYGRNIVINQDGTYCTSLMFGSITDRPEQHLANRIAAYYGVVRRKYELDLITSLMPELTPAHYLTLFGDVLTYPIAFKRDWRDDVTSVTSLVIVGGNDPCVEYATVTLNLTNVSTDYIGDKVVKGESLNIILYTTSGYYISTVVVTMGETDITSSAYNSSTGVISIASVTEDISITARAEEPVEEIITPTYSVTAKKRVNGNGVVESNSYYSMTSPVQVYAGDVVTYICSGYNSTSVSTLALTDVNHTYYTKVYDGTGQSSQSATKTRVYEVLEDGYVAFSYYTSKGLNVTIRRTIIPT